MKSFIKCVFLFLLAFPFVTFAEHSWNGYHWARKANPFNLKVYDNLTSATWKGHLATTITHWNAPSTTKVINLIPLQGFQGKTCKMVNGTVQVCNGGYGFKGWIGLATIYINGKHIYQGAAKMNDSYFNSSYYNNPNERLHVVCQEVAHTFGLDHQSEDGSSQNSCMDYFSNTGTNALSTLSTTPNAHDFNELLIIYTHLDLIDTFKSISAPVLAKDYDPVDHNDPNTWGQLVSQTHDGRGSIYERIQGPVSKSLTHVYWTEKTAEACPSCDHRYHPHD